MARTWGLSQRLWVSLQFKHTCLDSILCLPFISPFMAALSTAEDKNEGKIDGTQTRAGFGAI